MADYQVETQRGDPNEYQSHRPHLCGDPFHLGIAYDGRDCDCVLSDSSLTTMMIMKIMEDVLILSITDDGG